MPDIAMCKGGGCPMRERCYRFTATPSEHRQSYFVVPPYVSTDERIECDHFYPVDKP